MEEKCQKSESDKISLHEENQQNALDDPLPQPCAEGACIQNETSHLSDPGNSPCAGSCGDRCEPLECGKRTRNDNSVDSHKVCDQVCANSQSNTAFMSEQEQCSCTNELLTCSIEMTGSEVNSEADHSPKTKVGASSESIELECLSQVDVEGGLEIKQSPTEIPSEISDPECNTNKDCGKSLDDSATEDTCVHSTHPEKDTESKICNSIESLPETPKIKSESIDYSATSLVESQQTTKDGTSLDDFSGEPPHDVHVAIINGPVSLSRSDNLDTSLAGESVSWSLADGDSTNQDEVVIPAYDLIESFEEEPDVDPELLEVNNMIQIPEQEIPPLYEVGPSVTAECEICLEHKTLYLRLCCGTPICDVCMTTYLESVIKTGKVKIECPGLCQQKYIHRDEIIGRVSVDMKEKYCKFLVDANNEPHIKTCPRCSHVLVVELSQIRNPRVKKKGFPVTCPECQLFWCFPCQAPWHEGITCKEHRKGNKLLRKWAKEKFMGQLNAQRCPKCKVFIQRITGCDHMTCSKCDTSFCYRCGERYLHLKCIGDHYSRFSIFGCKYIYKPDNPLQRKFVRGSIFGAKLLAAPVVGVLAVAVGSVLLSGALIFFLPCYGVNKFRKHRRELRKRQASAEEYRRWRQRLDEIHSAGDPYIAHYNRLHGLGVNPGRMAAVAEAHQKVRGSSFISNEVYEPHLRYTSLYGSYIIN